MSTRGQFLLISQLVGMVAACTLSLSLSLPALAQTAPTPAATLTPSPAPTSSTTTTDGPGTPRPSRHPSYKELTAPPDPNATPWDKLKLTDSKGKTFSLDTYRGKLLLINFFFAHCPDVCPPQTAGLGKVMKGLKPETKKSVQFVSITIDPDNDTVAQLESYKKQFGIDTASWTFARMSKEELAQIGKHFGSLSGDPKAPLDHKARLYLINPKGGYLLSYDSAPMVDIARLTKDLTDAVDTFIKPVQKK